MAIFARVADKETFRAAAKELGLAPSRISEIISDLENYLNTSLFYRSTRKLTLTNEGRLLYAHVLEMLKNAEAGLNELNLESSQLVGSLKISLPAFLETSFISEAIAEFVRQNKQISLTLFYSDHIIDILSESLDLSIRAYRGQPKDSGMMSRKLGEVKRILVAGKGYVAQHQKPTHPSDLKSWDWIEFRMRPNTIEFISKTGENASVSLSSRISVNSASAMRLFALQNLGLAILPENFALEHISSGEFVEILPNWQIDPVINCYAVWPDKSLRDSLTVQLVRFIADFGT